METLLMFPKKEKDKSHGIREKSVSQTCILLPV